MLLTGVGLGFLVAAQVGPIWLLCVRSVLHGSFRAGIGIGFGAAVVDVIYALLGMLGVAALTQITAIRLLMSIVGTLVLVWMGVSAIRDGLKGGPESGVEAAVSYPTSFRSGLARSLAATSTNPLTIASWASAFAATSAVSGAGISGAILMLCGIGLGTLLWFGSLSTFVFVSRRAFSARALRVVDVVSGIALVVFGAVLFISANFNR